MWKGSRRHQSCRKESHQFLTEGKPLYFRCSVLHLKVNCGQLSQHVVNSVTLKPFCHLLSVPVRKFFRVLNAGCLSSEFPWGWEGALWCPSLPFMGLNPARVDPRMRWHLVAGKCLLMGQILWLIAPQICWSPNSSLEDSWLQPIHSAPSILCEPSMSLVWVPC